MKKMLIVAIAVAVPLALYGDVVELTTGEKFEGKVIARDESGITLKVDFGLIIIENKFVKSIKEDGQEADKPGEAKKPDDSAREAELEARKLKTRLEKWMTSRNKLRCTKCGGDGKEKCRYCKGTAQQPADPHGGTMRG